MNDLQIETAELQSARRDYVTICNVFKKNARGGYDMYEQAREKNGRIIWRKQPSPFTFLSWLDRDEP